MSFPLKRCTREPSNESKYWTISDVKIPRGFFRRIINDICCKAVASSSSFVRYKNKIGLGMTNMNSTCVLEISCNDSERRESGDIPFQRLIFAADTPRNLDISYQVALEHSYRSHSSHHTGYCGLTVVGRRTRIVLLIIWIITRRWSGRRMLKDVMLYLRLSFVFGDGGRVKLLFAHSSSLCLNLSHQSVTRELALN